MKIEAIKTELENIRVAATNIVNTCTTVGVQSTVESRWATTEARTIIEAIGRIEGHLHKPGI